MLDHQGF